MNLISAHLEIPEGETLGASFTFAGETWYVTQSEIDRVKNLPSASELTAMIATFNRFMLDPAAPEQELADDYARNEHR